MTEELGVFKIAVPKDIYLKYFYRRKEAEQFPQFKFVPLKELENMR